MASLVCWHAVPLFFIFFFPEKSIETVPLLVGPSSNNNNIIIIITWSS